MNKLKEIYEKYYRIWCSYEGENTDWRECYFKLRRLRNQLDQMELRNTKSYQFNSYIKKNLKNTIKMEMNRVYALALKYQGEE